MSRLTAAHLFALTATLLSACSKPPPADNVLFVSFDTTRADRIAAYGYGLPTTPNVDALADEGVLFERAFSHVASTLPAHTSMFTGLLPPEHGVRCNGWYRVPPEHETLAETLRAHDFATGAIIGAFPLDNRFGLDQGFDVYDARFDSAAPVDPGDRRPDGAMDQPGQWLTHDYLDFERSAEEVTDRAIGWLERRGRRERWFLFAHYFDAHWPYEPTAPWAARFESPYDAELAYADHHLGRLLEYVENLPGRTLIVFTADHGEGLGDHGEDWHNRYVYNSTNRVPLIVRLPGTAVAGRRVATNVSHVDLQPTILELLEVEGPESPHGRSLVPALGAGDLELRDIYAETLVWSLEMPRGISVRALIRDDYKWIRTDKAAPAVPGRRVEVYDMRSDPAELLNLAAEVATDSESARADEFRAMSDELDRWSDALESTGANPQRMPLDDATTQKLKALGYLGD